MSRANEGRDPAGNNRFQTFHPLAVVSLRSATELQIQADPSGSTELRRQPEYGGVLSIIAQSSITADCDSKHHAAAVTTVSVPSNDAQTLISRARGYVADQRQPGGAGDDVRRIRCPTKPLQRHDGGRPNRRTARPPFCDRRHCARPRLTRSAHF